MPTGAAAAAMRSPRSPATWCARIVDSTAFTGVILTVILLNAVVLGAETYPALVRERGGLLETLNDVFLGVFVVELAIRIGAYGSRPDRFFRSGWNVFDFVVIGASFVPGLGANATILRLVRLARIVRVISLLPDLRLLLVAVGRSIPPILSMVVLGGLVVYVYGIVGWMLFGEVLPERWGDIGTAMLNLFVMLSLENLPVNLEEAMAVKPWSWIYFVSFALVAAFLLLNILIGIVINSMEEARQLEHRRERQRRREAITAAQGHPIDESEGRAMIAERIETLRDALHELEEEVALVHGEAPPGRATS